MLYELRIDVYVEHQSDLNDVLDKLNDLKHEMKVINPGQPDQECSVIETIENHHDVHPALPCFELSHWDNCPLLPP